MDETGCYPHKYQITGMKRGVARKNTRPIRCTSPIDGRNLWTIRFYKNRPWRCQSQTLDESSSGCLPKKNNTDLWESKAFQKGEIVSDLNVCYFDWPEHNYQSGESTSIPKQEIVKLFEFVETEAITERVLWNGNWDDQEGCYADDSLEMAHSRRIWQKEG